MLFVNFLLLFMNSVSASSSCPVEPLVPNTCTIDKNILESVSSFHKESTQKSHALLENTQFQKIVSEIQGQIPNTLKKEEPYQQVQLFVLVSFSLGEKALMNLAQEAKHYGATLVLKGFKNGSLKQTAQALHQVILKTGQGVMIDPELFSLFNITAVPTFILAKSVSFQDFERIQTPIHDRLQGHVGIRYVLEAFAKEGDLKPESKSLLQRGCL